MPRKSPSPAASSSSLELRPSAPTVVVAMGGHAFIQPGERGTYDDHARNARTICASLITLVERGYNLVVTHGNGPQVGELLQRSELTRDTLPALPLDVLVAQTEGSLGYLLQRSLLNELRRRSIERFVVTMITQVLVDARDPAFSRPSKPVGPFFSQAEAERARDAFGWIIGEDAGRGWRRRVPSPKPQRIIQRDTIREAAAAGDIVIAAGGGGIPVTMVEDEGYVGIEAVIDKDAASGHSIFVPPSGTAKMPRAGSASLPRVLPTSGLFSRPKRRSPARGGASSLRPCALAAGFRSKNSIRSRFGAQGRLVGGECKAPLLGEQ